MCACSVMSSSEPASERASERERERERRVGWDHNSHNLTLVLGDIIEIYAVITGSTEDFRRGCSIRAVWYPDNTII